MNKVWMLMNMLLAHVKRTYFESIMESRETYNMEAE